MSQPFSVLRVRNFRLYFAGQLFSNIGTWFQALAQSLLVLELSGSAMDLALVTALQFTPTLLLGPYGGVLADRLRPRTVLLATSTLAALVSTLLALVTALGHVSVAWVHGLALLLGCAQALDRPSAQTFLYELVGPEDLAKAASLHSITQSSARMVGPALGGVAYTLLGSAACFAVNAASFLCVALALSRMRGDQLWTRERSAPEAGASVLPGLRYVLANPELRAPLLVGVLVACMAMSFMTTITSMVRFELHGGATAVGAAHALNAAGAVLGSLLIGARSRPPSLAVLASTCFALAFTIAVNALAPSLLAFLLWAPIFGFAVGAYQTALLTQVQHATQPAMLGRVSGLLALATVGVMPIASLIAGAMIELWSARAAMGLGACACALAGLTLLRPLARRLASRESPV